MNLETILAEIDKLSPEDREQIKNHLVLPEQARLENVKRTIANLDAAIDEFWNDSSEEEMQLIFEAMRTKSTPSEKGV